VFAGGFLLLGGRAADLLGNRRMFIFALALYASSSLVAGFAWHPAVIIVARAVQGIGGAFLFPATLSLINRLFAEGPERNRALAVWGGAGATGLTLGSLVGGLLTNAFGWPSVFFVNVLLAGLAIVAAFVVIPSDRSRQGHRSFDLPGAITITAGVTLIVYVLVQGPEYGWGSMSIVTSVAFAVISLVMFAVIEARSRQVAVLGFVKNPGRYKLEGTTARVTDVIAMAGGPVSRTASAHWAIMTNTRPMAVSRSIVSRARYPRPAPLDSRE
jgi:MFS family permease